ncbi:GGDEF domain-containing protein [Balneatrix alpica]|uniref:diguanylate cyclase n=1 Tax=Balneatrix alpica TaxID=75684 RepID=A0ABV5ZBW3_9GAMM|nr:GGDEF domain-containing protein [Balneatrix alpica]
MEQRVWVITLVSLWLLSPWSWGKNHEVVLQLKWLHQFQFAGYYAALHKGFYEAEGLQVRIEAGRPGLSEIEQVLKGEAQYGISNSGLITHRLRGSPVILLSAVVQHSPSAWIVAADSDIFTPHDLAGKRLMAQLNESNAELLAMLRNEGIALSDILLLPSSFNIDSLVQGDTDAFNGYVTNEPFTLSQQRFPYRVLRPSQYGIDFYSDFLFTSEAELRQHPKRVEAFRRASMKGWQYALEHPYEMIELIRAQYNPTKSADHLFFEAEMLSQLIMPAMIELGHINPGRIERMAKELIAINLAPAQLDRLNSFIYDAAKVEHQRLSSVVTRLSWWSGLISLIALVFLLLLVKLWREMRQRRRLEQRLLFLAEHDHLTQLYNRGTIESRVRQQVEMTRHKKQPFSLALIDLDFFKHINDRFGHPVGDQTLISIAHTLKANLPPGCLLGRYGGEEFLLGLPGYSLVDAYELCEQLRKSIKTCVITLPGQLFHPSGSIGVGELQTGQALETLLSDVDKALYQAKMHGRDQVLTVDPDNSQTNANRSAL